ncbi:MAG: sugar phosphate nucleotidyltransferase [Candidatus Hodarchaeales archaeon]|jgi:glucose-1-phosphate thymidylyltransferase
MKGIVLAGGTGSRLGPLSRVTNKHLLPIGNAPMIYYPIAQLICNGIKEICIVSGLNHLSSVVSLLGSGSRFGCSFTYKVQDEAGGIAEALALCQSFSGDSNIAVFLGDNVFGTILDLTLPDNFDAVLFLKEVPDPQRFGVAQVDHLKCLVDIQEKPKNPMSNLAVTGVYVYSPVVWEMSRKITRSIRGELEISDVNKLIIKSRQILTREVCGWWQDAGTQDSYRLANQMVWDNMSNDLSNIIGRMIRC